MTKYSIQVVGGSASTAFALDGHDSWPEQIAKQLPHSNVRHKHLNGLTFVRSINLLLEIPTADILILHFGTSVGWPTAVVNLGHKFGLDLHNEFSFHQPAENYRGGLLARLKKSIKLRVRNSIKYILFFLGLYRPRASFRELEEQITTVLSLAFEKSSHIIWIQHRSLEYSRIALERLIYRRYYKKILECLNNDKSPHLHVLEIDNDFLVPENYKNDGIHLSEHGHQVMARKILDALNDL